MLPIREYISKRGDRKDKTDNNNNPERFRIGAKNKKTFVKWNIKN